jgi:hypothetical protein
MKFPLDMPCRTGDRYGPPKGFRHRTRVGIAPSPRRAQSSAHHKDQTAPVAKRGPEAVCGGRTPKVCPVHPPRGRSNSGPDCPQKEAAPHPCTSVQVTKVQLTRMREYMLNGQTQGVQLQEVDYLAST